jgi:hypothetical protein
MSAYFNILGWLTSSLSHALNSLLLTRSKLDRFLGLIGSSV